MADELVTLGTFMLHLEWKNLKIFLSSVKVNLGDKTDGMRRNLIVQQVKNKGDLIKENNRDKFAHETVQKKTKGSENMDVGI